MDERPDLPGAVLQIERAGIPVAATGEDRRSVQEDLDPGHVAAVFPGDGPLRPGHPAGLAEEIAGGELHHRIRPVGPDPDGDILAIDGAGVDSRVPFLSGAQQAAAPLHQRLAPVDPGEDGKEHRHGR